MQRGKKRNRQLDFWAGTPLLNLLATFRFRRKHPPRRINTMGVMCSPALGDTLLFSSVLQDLRAAFPNTRIVHFCMRQNLAAAEIIPGADWRVVVSLTSPRTTIRRMRENNVDVFLDFTSWQRLTAFYTMMSRAHYTVGFRTPGQRRSRGYDRTILHRSDRHEVENFRALVAGSGLTLPPHALHQPAIDVHEPDTPLFPHAPDIVCLHPWASGQRAWLREWPEERWIELAQRLNGGNTLFLVTGAGSDLPRIRPFVEKMELFGLECEPFVSPDGFRTLTSVLLRSRLVISVNTGVMHLAAIAGARTVAINGPNRNGRWGPVGPHAVGVEAPGKGCGYLHLGFEFDGRVTDCMKRISVEAVYTAALELLAHDRPGARQPSPVAAAGPH